MPPAPNILGIPMSFKGRTFIPECLHEATRKNACPTGMKPCNFDLKNAGRNVTWDTRISNRKGSFECFYVDVTPHNEGA